MAAADRNTKVVAALVASVTLGAGLLLGLESAPLGAGRTMIAERPFDSIEFRFVSGEPSDEFDCVVSADGAVEWRRRDADLLVGVCDSGSDRLSSAQRTELARLMQHGRSRNTTISLAEASDARRHPRLAPAAHDLYAWLLEQGLIR